MQPRYYCPECGAPVLWDWVRGLATELGAEGVEHECMIPDEESEVEVEAR